MDKSNHHFFRMLGAFSIGSIGATIFSITSYFICWITIRFLSWIFDILDNIELLSFPFIGPIFKWIIFLFMGGCGFSVLLGALLGNPIFTRKLSEYVYDKIIFIGENKQSLLILANGIIGYIVFMIFLYRSLKHLVPFIILGVLYGALYLFRLFPEDEEKKDQSV